MSPIVASALALVACMLAAVRPAAALPNPGPLSFMGPTPAANATVTATPITIQLDATCSFDESTLAVSLNGTNVPASSFVPFAACSNGRKASRVVNVGLTIPNGTISTAPTTLNVPQSANFSGSGNGTGLAWNFDGGAAPATGSSVSATFNAAGTFTVRLSATRTQALDASGMDGGNLVTAERDFASADPTPDTRVVTARMPAEVDFRNYEVGHVHPIALNAAGTQLYAVNTPEGRLAIFNVSGGNLAFAGDVPVGLDPVSLAVRPGTNEVWVVNQISDTVSIVDVVARKLLATIAVGDEPADVVFAGSRAFVSLAGNVDAVKAYDAATRAQVGSTLSLFAEKPRALAANAAGTEVYAVAMESGNKTTALFEDLVSAGGGPPAPNPPRSPALGAAPATSLVVKFNPSNNRWEDEVGGNWTSRVNYSLPDNDVFVIDADAPAPAVIRTANGVGTLLLDVAVNPATGELWVPNTEARNLVRFEPNLVGHLVQTRVTRVNAGTGTVAATVDLNPHINYTTTPGPAGEVAASLAQPGDGVFTASGATYYLTAFGSGKVAVLNSAGAVTARITVGGGPSGVALAESAQRLFVTNRFDNTISIVNTATNAVIGTIGIAGPGKFDPSPDVIKAGRKFLYDAALTSGHGDVSCATCHIFGNLDGIAWDLGEPQGAFLDYNDAPWVTFAPLGPSTNGFDPMKGPMTTQTLRGLSGLEPFHWRGDRQNFQAFNGAFANLLGRSGPLSTADMNAYTDFIMTVNFPPNPFRNLDNTMPASLTVPNQTGGGATATGNPNTGQNLFLNTNLDGGAFTCNLCHTMPTGTSTNLFNGQLENETQDFKIPHLRNMYEKVGFDVIRPNLTSGNGSNIGTPTQKKGFGFIHDGAVSLTEFLAAPVFTSTTQQERDVFAFMLAFPTESPPAIGRQVTVTSANKNDSAVTGPIGTLVAQAEAAACDLVVKGVIGGVTKGWVYDPSTNNFEPDSLLESPLSETALRGAVAGSDVVTYTGVPPGAGVRLGVDRDRDTFLDRTEIAAGTDPADPHSNPWRWAP